MGKTLIKYVAPFFFSIAILLSFRLPNLPELAHAQEKTTFWKYQCIDTMKESRDNARSDMNDPKLTTHIAWEMKTIKSLGANCVAIDTPYDPEFLPYLTKWVQGAREQHLQIWFRGNFSGWEGWFGYPKITSTTEELTKLDNFIRSNSQLFQDGDIFTGTPEAENGGPFGQVNPDKYTAYRQFLIDQDTTEQKAFANIGKHITTNWFSMNGDVANNMYDQQTLNKIGNVVTVDHYIRDPNDMGSIISHFKNTYGSSFMLGEFGAPVPDLNGPMTEDQQADFVDKVLQQLYEQREHVVGINYWDFYDGSTALMNPDQSPRKVTKIIKKYFDPAVVKGKITDEKNTPLADIVIKTDDNGQTFKTDKNGDFSFPTTATDLNLRVTHQDASASASITDIKPGETYQKNLRLIKPKKSFKEKLQEFLNKLFH